MDIVAIWVRIEHWFQLHAPQLLKNLREGVSSEEIQRLETALGYSLPEDLYASLRIHNGTYEYFADIWQLLSVDDILREHQAQLEVLQLCKDQVSEGETVEEYVGWYPHWIPFAYDGSGDLLCTAAHIETEELAGYIMEYDHETGTKRIASSYGELFAQFADDLDAGRYTVDEDGLLGSEQFLFTDLNLKRSE